MKLRELKGIGEKTEKLFQKIGLETTEDLLQYYPRTYDAYQEPVSIGEIGEGSLCAIRGTITSGIYLNQVRNLSVVSVTAADNSGKISLTCFNARYLKSFLK